MKERLRVFWSYFKNLGIKSLLLTTIYLAASTVSLLVMLRAKELTLSAVLPIWVVCIVVAFAYNFFFSWTNGGLDYEMLVAGNIKRMAAEERGELKVSRYKEDKEYRVWKGFFYGAIPALLVLVTGLVFGGNQNVISSALTEGKDTGNFGITIFTLMMLSGWSVIPMVAANAGGAAVSYFLSLLFALVPIVLSGAGYICGAYAKRAKALRQQAMEEAERARQENRPKKINYGGLPGTKPKKRK
ncbi:MAG: hypothetical protein IJV80_01990 [Clostridia bacterium]|nr:hypothetical protein [Clostridia bacterium]